MCHIRATPERQHLVCVQLIVLTPVGRRAPVNPAGGERERESQTERERERPDLPRNPNQRRTDREIPRERAMHILYIYYTSPSRYRTPSVLTLSVHTRRTDRELRQRTWPVTNLPRIQAWTFAQPFVIFGSSKSMWSTTKS